MAGNDIFGYKRNGKAQGVFSTANSKMNMQGGSASGYLVQNWNTSYNQDVREIFEIGSDNLYWAKGRPSGTGSISRIVGYKDPFSSSGFFPKDAFDLCKGGVQVTLTAKGGHCDTAPIGGGGNVLNRGVKIIMDGVVVSAIGFSQQASANIHLTESFGWRFGYMEIATF
jgi:hypothetical protein